MNTPAKLSLSALMAASVAFIMPVDAQASQIVGTSLQKQSAIALSPFPLQASAHADSTELGQRFSGAIAQINLTPAQQEQLEAALNQRFQAAIAQLNLTAEQQAQIKGIAQQISGQVQAVLTLEQQQALLQAIQNGAAPQEALAAVNLTEAQKSELQAIQQSTRQQVSEVLTFSQRRQLMRTLRSQ